jgi:hypothetical protein
VNSDGRTMEMEISSLSVFALCRNSKSGGPYTSLQEESNEL